MGKVLTVELLKPSSEKFIKQLILKGEISIIKEEGSWQKKWEELSMQLPNTEDVGLDHINEEIESLRSGKA